MNEAEDIVILDLNELMLWFLLSELPKRCGHCLLLKISCHKVCQNTLDCLQGLIYICLNSVDESPKE